MNIIKGIAVTILGIVVYFVLFCIVAPIFVQVTSAYSFDSHTGQMHESGGIDFISMIVASVVASIIPCLLTMNLSGKVSLIVSSCTNIFMIIFLLSLDVAEVWFGNVFMTIVSIITMVGYIANKLRKEREENMVEEKKRMVDGIMRDIMIGKRFDINPSKKVEVGQDEKNEIKKDIIHAIILIGGVIVITFLLAYVIIY